MFFSVYILAESLQNLSLFVVILENYLLIFCARIYKKRIFVMKNKISMLLVCVGMTLPVIACKQSEPTYSETNLAQNQAYATQTAKMASENALKTAKPPKLESSKGVVASFPLPIPAKTTSAS